MDSTAILVREVAELRAEGRRLRDGLLKAAHALRYPWVVVDRERLANELERLAGVRGGEDAEV